jgi:hypothetical protein
MFPTVAAPLGQVYSYSQKSTLGVSSLKLQVYRQACNKIILGTSYLTHKTIIPTMLRGTWREVRMYKYLKLECSGKCFNLRQRTTG